jgi:type IV pilus assembly protein PilE
MLSRRGSGRGFSLVEVLMALAIATVLATLALPNFERQLQRARRGEALVASLQVQTAQERHRSQSPRYGALAEIGLADVTPGGHYLLEILSRDADGFELLASATGRQSRDADCRHLRLQSRHLTASRASGPDRQVANGPDANRRCWGHG